MPTTYTLYGENSTSQVELDDCPFCVSERARANPCLIITDDAIPLTIEKEAIWKEEKTIYVVACGRCGTRGPWGNDEFDAARFWNRRVGKGV